MWPLLCRRRPFATSAAGGGAAAAERLAVFAWGTASQGVLGLGPAAVDQYEPAEVEGLPSDIVSVGAGHFHSLAVTSDGGLWSWGRNKEWQLGRPLAEGEHEHSPSPQLVAGGLERHSVAAATGSGVATFVVTAEGLLYSFGSSKRGQLGLGTANAMSCAARRIEVPGKVTQVSAGWGHAAALLGE